MSIKTSALLLATVTATCLGAATGHAASARTWVSNVGSDSNPCSITQPCQTFQGALANTSSGGEINCLTPGGFGGASGVTIAQSVTISCKGTSNGGISVSGGTSGVTVNNAGITVNLIGLDISSSSGGGAGVNITAAAVVNVRDCVIYGFSASGVGINLTTGTLIADNVLVTNNYFGIAQQITSGVSNMTVRNSNINNNINYGVLVELISGTHAGATIEQTTLSFNGAGLGVGSGAVAVIGDSTVVSNGTGVFNEGALYSFKNNQIGGNGSDGTPLTAYPGGPLN
jgi:hypothetical protein